MACTHRRGKSLFVELRVSVRATPTCNCCLQRFPLRRPIWGCRVCNEKFCAICHRERFWKHRIQITDGAFVTMNLEATVQVCGSKPGPKRCTGQIQSVCADRRTAWVNVGLNTLHRIAVCWLTFERQGKIELGPPRCRANIDAHGVVNLVQACLAGSTAGQPQGVKVLIITDEQQARTDVALPRLGAIVIHKVERPVQAQLDAFEVEQRHRVKLLLLRGNTVHPLGSLLSMKSGLFRHLEMLRFCKTL